MKIGRGHRRNRCGRSTASGESEDLRLPAMRRALVAHTHHRIVKGDHIIVVVIGGCTGINPGNLLRREIKPTKTPPTFGPATDVVNQITAVAGPIRGFKRLGGSVKFLQPAVLHLEYFEHAADEIPIRRE